jgi:septum formation protein
MKKFILASTSPRRIELLKQSGYRFTVIAPNIDESIRPRESARAMVLRLSAHKAVAVARGINRKQMIVLAADTCVVSPAGKILGKPTSGRSACQMLKSLQGKVHTVYTGYALFVVEGSGYCRLIQRAVRTRVRMAKLNDAEIKRYVATGEPMDKAGAYAAQGIGMGFIESLNGSYSNVVGLPMNEVRQDLDWAFKI